MLWAAVVEVVRFWCLRCCNDGEREFYELGKRYELDRMLAVYLRVVQGCLECVSCDRLNGFSVLYRRFRSTPGFRGDLGNVRWWMK